MIVDLLTYYRFAFLLLFPNTAECDPVCQPPYSCISTRECAARYPKDGTEEVLFQCAKKTKVCCPPAQDTVINPTLPDTSDFSNHHLEPKNSSQSSKFTAAKHFTEYDYLKKLDFTSHRNAHLLGNGERCGVGGFDNKISQGDDVVIGELPWMALIGYRGIRDSKRTTFFCGGTLINDYYVLTAAHCVTIKDKEPEFVRLGEHDISQERDCTPQNPPVCLPPHLDISVEKIIVHTEWDENTLKNDIALIKLSENATEKAIDSAKKAKSFPVLAKICLPLNASNISFTNTTLYEVAGWGKTESNHDHGSNVLKKAGKKLILGISLEECNRACTDPTKKFCPIDKSQICIQGYKGVDVCKGDSGGPLMYRVGTKTQQVGVVSFKPIADCAVDNIPSVFTNVVPYLSWILDSIDK